MKDLWIDIERYSYTAKSSIGRMSFEYDGKKEFFAYTLEDAARAWGVKVYGETCLPTGLNCNVALFENKHFGKTIIFYTEPDKMTIIYGPLSWVGCLAHGGNDADDTAGCVLVARQLINPDFIYGTMKDVLRQFVEGKIKEGYTVRAKFTNLIQSQTRKPDLPPIKINIISLWRTYRRIKKWLHKLKLQNHVLKENLAGDIR